MLHPVHFVYSHRLVMVSLKLFGLFVFIAALHNAFSANILGLLGTASYSHHLWNSAVVDALAERGHNLTLVSVDINPKPHPNIRYIHLEETYKTIEDIFVDIELPSGPIASLRMLSTFLALSCRGIIKSQGFQEALALDDSFDLVLFDIVGGPCLLKLITMHPKIPVVALDAFKITPELLHIAGGHIFPSYIPLLASELELPMNYWNRLYNTGTYFIYECYRKYVMDRIINNMVSKHIPSEKTNPTNIEEQYNRIKLFLINTNPALDFVQSLPPNIIEVGGLNIKEPKPLPKDIDEFINSSKNGAIFISLGTNVRIEMLGEKNVEYMVNVIERFPDYNFLWKVNKPEFVKRVPKNLLIRKWFSQNDLLAHPKVKVFFTHAGGLSTNEATWYGIPVVAMPFMADQFRNARRIRENNLGTVVDPTALTEQSIYDSLAAVLTDDTYRNNMRAMQKKFKDRPSKPLDTAIWWIEYALRTPDLEHLIPAARHMSFFVANSLDALLTFAVIVVIFFINFWIVVRNLKATLTKKVSKTKATKKVKRN